MEQIAPEGTGMRISGKVYGYIVLKYWIFRNYSEKTPDYRRKDFPLAKKEGEVFAIRTCGKLRPLLDIF